MKRPTIDAPVQRPTQRQSVQRPTKGGWEASDDTVAREEPLEILVKSGGDAPRRLGLLLRTPGHDQELALGLLYAEALIEGPDDVKSVKFEPAKGENQEFNSVVVTLATRRRIDWERVARPLVMTAACGVCGRAMLSGLHEHAARAAEGFTLGRETLLGLPARLREHQDVFERTGGLHGSALFDAKGTLHLVREDVGRHNAVDKVVGHAFQIGALPLKERVLLVSGRAGYEIIQKAVRAGIPMVAAVGAPSSLAVETAKEFGLTLVGFLREGRFNVYCGAGRLAP